MNFRKHPFNFVFCSNGVHLCCGGNHAILDMLLEMGVDVEEEVARQGLNAFFAEQVGEGRLFVGDWPKEEVEGYDMSAVHESKESCKRRRSCHFFLYRTREDMLSPMAIIALCAMYAGRRR